MKHVWIFNGANAPFPSGVFSAREPAEAWIRQQQLSGTLTLYPLDVPALDWAVQQGHFHRTRAEHSTPSFVQSFTSASQPHHHYVDGFAED